MKRKVPLAYEVTEVHNISSFAARICSAIESHWPMLRPEFEITKLTPFGIAVIRCSGNKQPLSTAEQAEVNGFIQGYVFCADAVAVIRQIGK